MASKYMAALLPSLAFALPQQSSLDDIPPCAFPPLLSALSGTSCDQADIGICAQDDIIPTMTTNVVAACPGTLTEQDVTSFIAELCGATAASPESSSSVAESVTSAASSTTATTALITTDGTPLTTTTANATMTAASTTAANGTCSCTQTPSANATTTTTTPSNGSADGLKASFMAAAVAVAGLTWVFAEL
ncbi:hypothetical protein BST61_g1518 [Cercospora zeina]